jgi:ribosome recycling factor
VSSATYGDLKKDVRRRMDSALDVLKKEFSGLRTGRASANLLDPIMVDAYGSLVPLSQVANVNVPEPRMILVQVWDKSTVKSVEKAIRDSGLGLNPSAEGQTVRVPIPALNEERRLELQKIAGKYAEQARISVRNVRRDGMDQLKKLEKDSKISQDELRQYEKELQSLTDETIKRLDESLSLKEKEIIQV